MESFIDNDAEILWYKDDLDYDSNQVNDELNSWKSARIKEYITDCDREPLGDFLRDSTRDTKGASQFFGFINGELASTVVVKSDARLDEFAYVGNHINNIEQNKIFVSSPFLSQEKAKVILANEKTGKGNDDIMYVIINPERLKKGYGTRVISSVKNNIDFFAPNSNHVSLKCLIHSSNWASRTIFEKNDFRKLNMSRGPMIDYFMHYFLDDMEK